MIWMADTAKLCTFFNKGWLDFRGRSMEEELGYRWAEGIHPQDLDECLATYTRAFDARRPFTMEYRLRRHDGEYRWILDNGVPHHGPDRAFLGYIGSCIDITERREAELSEARQRNELAHLSRVATLGELSGAIAHEVSQPLAAILSNAQAAQRLLSRDPADLAEVRRVLDDIVQDDQRAREVISRLRLLLHKGEVRRQPFDLGDLVHDVLRLVSSDLVLNKVTADTELADDLPAVHGDRVQIQQVLLNLIVNACHAMAGPTTAERRLTLRTRCADGGRIEVTVSDVGPGIPPDDLERIFEPFFTTHAGGMGLGLAVCRTIVRAHGGALWATNNAGGGASLHFALPVQGPSASV